MIGMILLAVLAALIFFGVSSHFFSKAGVANWVAFLIVFGVAIAAVFPPLRFGGISFSYAGFFVPLLLGLVLFFALMKTGGALRTLAGIPAVAGIVLSVRIALPPFANYVPSMLAIGFAGGLAAFVIGKSRLAVLSSVMLGIVLGDVLATLLFRYVLRTSYMLPFGQYGIFDTFVLSVLVAGIAVEVADLIARAMHRHRGYSAPSVGAIEAGEDTDLTDIPYLSDDEDFDEYFNDDVD